VKGLADMNERDVWNMTQYNTICDQAVKSKFPGSSERLLAFPTDSTQEEPPSSATQLRNLMT
jgi:hypothetical protein